MVLDEYCVVHGDLVDIIIGGEILRPHEFTFTDPQSARHTLMLGKHSCEQCEAKLEDPRDADDPKLEFNSARVSAAKKKVQDSRVLPAQPSSEQIAQSESLRVVLQEFNIHSIVAPDMVKHEFMAIVS